MYPVLDKGYVKILASSLPNANFDNLLLRVNRNIVTTKMLDMPYLTLEIKCPLFVQLFLAENNICHHTCKIENEVEAYVPTISDVGSPDLATGESVQAHMQHTSESLIITIKTYQMDKCDKFIAQVNSPIAVYNTIVAWGSLRTWLDLISQKSLPKPIESYRKAIQDALAAEWPNWKHYTKQMRR